MVFVSADVTNPQLPPFILGDHFVDNGDGSVSIALDAAATTFGGREPLTSNRNDSTGTPGAYQKFTKQGSLLVSQLSWTDGAGQTQTDIRAFSYVEGRSF